MRITIISGNIVFAVCQQKSFGLAGAPHTHHAHKHLTVGLSPRVKMIFVGGSWFSNAIAECDSI